MSQDVQSAVEHAEALLGYVKFGVRAVKTLQSQCRLLQELPAVSTANTEDLTQRIEDLRQAIAGMEAHLQTLDDVVSNAQMYSLNIVEDGDALEDLAPQAFYVVCVDATPERRFTPGSSGIEHARVQDAFAELRQVRRKQPQAYVARAIYYRCVEPAEDAKPAKQKAIAA